MKKKKIILNGPKMINPPESKLYRPKINYLKVIVFVISHFVACEIPLVVFLCINDSVNLIDFISLQIYILPLSFLMFLVTLRYTLMWFIRLYQRYAKSETRLRCHMTPSCSEYSILALKKYGVLRGVPKMIGRFKRCSYPGSIDYP
ncbi:membrane protein insertion efficiency factor YidD [Bengtsoniella intestinalis]|uniref:membrane protein insertion efficiency factor YidD n=1 Tax=Bengtsoniella intestinalis TaxID=3073143 RepID=UPI00391F2A36